MGAEIEYIQFVMVIFCTANVNSLVSHRINYNLVYL